MADRVSATITIGGTLPASLFEELAGVIASEALAVEWDGEPFEPRHYEPGKPLTLFAHQVSGGTFDELEAWCVANGLAYSRWCDGYPGAWGAQRVNFNGSGETEEFEAPDEDRITLDRATCLQLGSFEAIIARFDAGDMIVPPLDLVDDQPRSLA